MHNLNSHIGSQPSSLTANGGTRTRKLKTRVSPIAIVGLGYVGLPLSLQFARSGVRVIGLDVDAAKVRSLNAGRSYIKHIPAGEVAKVVNDQRFQAASDFGLISKCRAVVICVPTPLNKNREPDISYILETG